MYNPFDFFYNSDSQTMLIGLGILLFTITIGLGLYLLKVNKILR